MRKSLLSLVLVSGCIIIENPDVKEVPVPVPQTEPHAIPVPFPGSGKEGDLGTDQLWLVRIERGTANLASAYESLISDMTFQLATSGVQIRTIAVASLHDGRILWAQGEHLPVPPTSLAQTLRHHASQSSGAVENCTTDALAAMGRVLSAAQVEYPDALYDSEMPPDPRLQSGRVFTSAPGAFLVGVIDHLARPLAPSAPGCLHDGSDPATHFAGSDPAKWLRTADGAGLPRTHTRFIWIGTSEGVTTESLRSSCLAQPHLPSGVLDSLEASPVPFFDPVTRDMNAHATGLATRVDLCEAIGGTWSERAKTFADAWVEALVQIYEAEQSGNGP